MTLMVRIMSSIFGNIEATFVISKNVNSSYPIRCIT